MVDQADSPNSGESPAAGDREPSIPKHRFDEILNQLKEERESRRMLQEHLQTVVAKQTGGISNPADELRPEDVGMEEDTFKAVKLVAEKIAETRMAQKEKEFRGIVGTLANRLDHANFLATYGRENEKYLERIHAMRVEHQRQTGQVMPMEHAFKMVKFDEMMAKGAGKPAAHASSAAPAASPQADVPNPAATHANPSANPNKPEQTIEELEAQLDAQLGGSTF